MLRSQKNQRGQSMVEMAVLFTAIIGALVFMLGHLQRGAQGMVKANADSLGQQYSTQNPWSSNSKSYSVQTSEFSDSTSCSDTVHAVEADGSGSISENPDCITTARPTGWQGD